MSDPHDHNEPITSSLAEETEDPEFAELLILFVQDLRARNELLEQAVRAADHEAIRRLAHAIKGAAGGYGFDTISIAATELDELAKSEAQVDQLAESFSALSSLCTRVRV